MEAVYANALNIQWQQVVMWIIGGALIYLAIKRNMEPALLLPMGFGAILVNLPMSGAVTQIYDGIKEIGVIDLLFDSG
ncbi:MAG: sodium ion-translocating decarboxylase subunit beta, partial [Oscillospiraceae bacterium]